MITSQTGYILSDQPPMMGHHDIKGFGSDEFRVEEIDRDAANRLVVENHYSGKFYNASYIHLGVIAGGRIHGVLQFGYAMNPTSQSGVVRGTPPNGYLELNRMWLDDALPRNSESRAISYAIKYIKRKYPSVKWIQSFADERCGMLGVVYQAANFGYYGCHVAKFWTLDDEVYHNSLMTRNPGLSKSAAWLQEHKDRATLSVLRQFRYLYFIDRKAERHCLLVKQPAPKWAAEGEESCKIQN